MAARLAACAQVGSPVTSTYRWQGEIETAQEWPVVFKTTAGRYAELEAFLRERHSYDVPEILAVPVAAGSAAYLAWLTEQSAPAADTVRTEPSVRTDTAGPTGQTGPA